MGGGGSGGSGGGVCGGLWNVWNVLLRIWWLLVIFWLGGDCGGRRW